MRYAVVERLGRGGMGVVDLATAPDGRRVALKRVSLSGSTQAMAQARLRLRREADVLRSLDHPAIVGLIEVLDDEGADEIVLVMPYLPGGSLSDAVAAAGPLPPEQVAAAAGRLLGALAVAHRQGVVHRDVKPANILFDEAGRALLADFGVAQTRDVTSGLTGTDLVIGTPGFMAPEQARGEPVTAASDVFSLGASLRFALTGEQPFGSGDAGAVLARAAGGKIARLPRTVPPELRHTLDAMCHPDARRRPTAAALAGGPEGTAPHPAVRPVGPARRGRARAAAVAAAVVLLGGTAAMAASRLDGAGAEAPPDVTVPDTTAATEPPCEDLPYQPCGEAPAPNTDGERCLPGFADYDDDPVTGCEAEADDVPDGTTIERGVPVEANLVPADDVDRWRYHVEDRFQLLCDGAVTVRFTAPPGTMQQLRVLDGDEELESVASADGTPVELRLRDPDCWRDRSTTLDLLVSSVGSDRSAEPYRLEVDGTY
jgi:hypothetical protein